MNRNGLDVFDPPSPTELVSDMKSAGVEYVGLYAYDDDADSISSATSQHVAAVRTGGLTPFPIVTQRTGTTATGATLWAAIDALGFMSGPVAFDIENTATPPASLIQEELSLLAQKGYGPFTCYLWPLSSWKGTYAGLFSYVWAGGETTLTLPPGCQAVQSGTWEGPSGTSYDVDYFDPSIFGAVQPVIVEEPSMYQVEVYDAANKQQHFIYFVQSTLYHRFYDEASGTMSNPIEIPNASGLNPQAGVSAVIAMSGTQLHVFTEWQNTATATGAHFFCDLPVKAGSEAVWDSQDI